MLVEDKSQIAEVITATTAMAWPVIAAFLLWKLFPLLKTIVETRSFTIKIGGMELSAQEATDQIKTQIEDLQKQVVGLREAGETPTSIAPGSATTPPPAASAKPDASILWVDDKPSGNAFEIAQLQGMGIRVVTASSTVEGMRAASAHPDFAAIISDMGRTEDGQYHGKAAIELLAALREAGITTPLIVYTTAKYAYRHNSEVISAGGDGAISSQVELLEWLKRKTGVASA